ncbi:MAG TPA: hypothetical protein VF630_16935 [Hymenobacter sp.]|jgi:hypothetical protein
MTDSTNQLPAEVAAHYELTSHSTRMYVTRLGRTVDLTTLTLAEAAELVALPGGFAWLRKREVPATQSAVVVDELPAKNAGPVAVTTGPARAKKKKTGARGEA